MQIGTEYLYLVGDAVHLAAAAILMIVLRTERWNMVMSGLLLLPSVVFGSIFDGMGWDPLYLMPIELGQLRIGVEDLLFCFAFGALAWGFGALGNRGTRGMLRIGPITWAVLRHAGPLALFGTAGIFGLWALGIPAYWAAIGMQAALAGFTVWQRPELVGVALVGALGLIVYYTAMLVTVGALLTGGVAALWPPEVGGAFRLIGIPIEEFLWTLSFGAMWAPLLVWVFQPVRRT